MGPTRASPARERRWIRWLPAALILGVFLLDLLTPRGVRVFILLAATPVLVAPWLSLAGTITTGVAALLAAVVLPLVKGRTPFGIDDVFPFSTFVTLTLLAAVINRLHIVYRTFADDPGVDYLVHHRDWDRAELLAVDDGHFMGPALSWPELLTAADNGLPGGSTTDPHARLLLLLPALGDDDVPDDHATERLASALRALVGVEDPEAVAASLLESQGPAGTARWAGVDGGVLVNDGGYSFRNPANGFALPPARLARVSAAFSP